jgi:hypothetical protein
MALTRCGLLVDKAETLAQLYARHRNWTVVEEKWLNERFDEQSTRGSSQTIYRALSSRFKTAGGNLPAIARLPSVFEQCETSRDKAQVLYFYLIEDDPLVQYAVHRYSWRLQNRGADGLEFKQETVERLLREFHYDDGSDYDYAEPPTLDTHGAIDVPEPDGEDHWTYRERLDVPTFDPRQGAASASLWYMTDDPEVLYRLQIAGIERWGHLKSLLEVGAVDGLLPETFQEQVRRHGTALEAFVEPYTIGRGKAVDRDVLEASGAVSDIFIDEVSALADRVDGDPDALLDGLPDISHFRQDKIDELRDYLRDEGYLDPRPKRPDDQIRSAVVDAYCRHGLESDTASTAADRLLNRISTDSEMR